MTDNQPKTIITRRKKTRIAGAHWDKAAIPLVPMSGLAACRKHQVSLPRCHKAYIPPGPTEIALQCSDMLC